MIRGGDPLYPTPWARDASASFLLTESETRTALEEAGYEAILWRDDPQRVAAEASRDAYQAMLTKAGLGEITTEIAPADEFYYAESYHQQYLAKNPGGYCGLGGTGVSCPVGVGVGAQQ